MKAEVFYPNQNRHIRFFMGLYIRRKRLESDLTVQDAATQLGLTPQAYRNIEGGRAKMKAEIFSKTLTLFQVDPSDLQEIYKISSVAYVNDLSKALGANYPL